ncbi:hypothetical protein BJ123_11340 [Rhodopseudomonas thermotolerans]|jgi:hypothetical protein|uniref:Lipoprotein n=2 Tax=Rhodopseudomonas TaxID=1073 RepID=A0A336JPY1_9BRAD|nr:MULTISPECIES: hypothetical protein [Rhodopseudomonas]RED31950.1 hypothetical protein BJ125_11340 [Rhodopseudomonas pentothenatexigens]REF93331.1 hypothetical protein BJ123_11340 [Rhodopseudomonas thermotolerans]SSW91622.1 hypothetical protein SAMN05892882_11340 [Rhodopseudomonas pentothenatexigens]
MRFPVSFKLVAAAIVLGALTACSSVPVTSMLKLARTDLSATDPAALRIAVRLPHGLRPRRVTLRVTVAVGAEKTEQAFVLADLDDPGELLSLAGEVTNDTKIYAFRMAPEDVPRLLAVRDQMGAHKAKGERGSLTIGVGAEACRIGTLPAKTLVTTYLKTERTGDFFPLTRDVDLRKDVPKEAAPERIPLCG